ncbi:MAG: DNA-binding transcriptional MerR regulator [Polaribacter sp.]
MSNDINFMTFKSVLHQVVELKIGFPEVMEHFESKPFKVIDLDIHPKIIADWNRKGLLLIKPEANKMHRFSLTEIVWIKMIDKMRQYNFPLETIKAFRDEALLPPQVSADDMWEAPFVFESLVTMVGEPKREEIKAFLKDPIQRKKVVSSLPPGILEGGNLEGLVVFCLLLKTPLSFLIHHSGAGILFNPLMLNEGLYDKDDLSLLMSSSYVSISLTEILAEVLSVAPIEVLNLKLQVISDQEANILSALREDELVSVVIRFDNKHEMDLMEIKKNQTASTQMRLLELMLTKGYQDITVKTQHGKIVHCENTRKVKLK